MASLIPTKIHFLFLSRTDIIPAAFEACVDAVKQLHPSWEIKVYHEDDAHAILKNAVDVLKTTGPFILTHAFEKFVQKEHVTILEHDTLYPLTMFETRKVLNDTITDDMQKRIDQTFAVHYFWGSW